MSFSSNRIQESDPNPKYERGKDGREGEVAIKGEEENGHDVLSSSLRKELLATAECARKEREDPVRKDHRVCQ